MAVDTEARRETVAAPSPPRVRIRLHEEILPPVLDGSSPRALRNAKRALAILAVGVVVLQLISAPIGHRLNSVARSGTDAYSEWQQYVSRPVPHVLVIGASPARTDVDEEGLGAQLSSAIGRQVMVEKLGFAGQTPLFLDALIYRIMKRQPHPQLIVLAVGGPELNDGCRACLASTSGGLWDISDLSDPNFIQIALRLDPNPARLVAGWMLPSLAYYPSLLALQCIASDAGRSAARAVLRGVPRQLQNPTVCESTAAYKWARQDSMTRSDYDGSLANFREFTRDYRVSPAMQSSLRDIIARSRAAGTNVVLLETPLHPGLRSSFPEVVDISHRQLHSLASNLNTEVVDLSDSVPDDPTLWVDGLHLDRSGATFIQARLAGELMPYLQP